MVEIEIVEIGEQQLAEVNAISGLSDSQKQQVLAAANFGSFSQKTQDVYAYLTEKLDENPTTFSVPAGIVAGILALAYDTNKDRQNFRNRQILAYPAYDDHWEAVSKCQIFNQRRLQKLRNSEGDIVFDVPGETEKKYVIGKKDGNRSQYIFMTPVYARFLITKGSGLVTKEFNEFLLKLHDEYVKFVKGQENELMAPVVKDERRELTNFEKMEIENRLLSDRAEIEHRHNMNDREQIENIKLRIDVLKGLDMFTDVDKMFFKEKVIQGPNHVPHAGQLLLKDSMDVDEGSAGVLGEMIEIKEQIKALGRNPRDPSAATSIGKRMAKKYREKYNEEPKTQEKFINGALRPTNVYFKKDLSMMHDAIKEYYNNVAEENKNEEVQNTLRLKRRRDNFFTKKA